MRTIPLRTALGAITLALLVVGCAADLPEADPADDGGDAMVWAADDDFDLEGVDLAIGSKDLPEQQILGWIAVEAARAAGANVHQEIGAGGTAVVRQAELSGLIDAYWEYTGTGWDRILQQTDPAGTSTELYDAVRDRDGDQNQIDWLPPAPMNSAYAIAASPATIEALGVRTLADLAEAFDGQGGGDSDVRGEAQADPVLCIDAGTDFADAPDGLGQFERAFDVTVPEAQRPEVETGQLYELVENGALCPFGQVLNTDPRLALGSLQVLEDQGTFTIYNPSMTIRADVADDVPGFADLIAEISPRLTDDVIRELRSAVELDRGSSRDVARRWLVDEGLTEVREGGA